MGDEDRHDLVNVRISVAKMEGMLSQALSDQGARLTNAESEVNILHGRVTEKGRVIIEHTGRLNGLEKAVHTLEQAKIGIVAKTVGIIGSCTAILALCLAAYNAMRIG